MVEPKSWKEYLATRAPAELPLRLTDVFALLTGPAVSGLTWGDLVAELTRLAETPRVVTESGPVLASDRIIILRCVDADIVLTLLSAAAARGLVIIRDDDTAYLATIQAAEGETLPTSEGRQASCELTMQDESLRLLPNGTTHWHRT